MKTTKTKTQVNKDVAELFESYARIQRRSFPDALSEAVGLLEANEIMYTLELPLKYIQIEIPYDVWGRMTALMKKREITSSYAWNTALKLFIQKYEVK
jgi:hypothetical protein